MLVKDPIKIEVAALQISESSSIIRQCDFGKNLEDDVRNKRASKLVRSSMNE